jgi:hypothetical protein
MLNYMTFSGIYIDFGGRFLARHLLCNVGGRDGIGIVDFKRMRMREKISNMTLSIACQVDGRDMTDVFDLMGVILYTVRVLRLLSLLHGYYPFLPFSRTYFTDCVPLPISFLPQPQPPIVNLLPSWSWIISLWIAFAISTLAF